LKPDEISGLVQSEFGYHIIRLIAVKPSKVLPFEDARESIVSKLRRQKATDIFAENAEKFKLEIEDYAALSARSAVVYFF